MELQGKVIAEMPERSGTSARGEWEVKEYVIEAHNQYPRRMVFSVFGEDRLQRFNVQVGQEVSVSFDIDAREYNGRWFNSIRAFDVRQVDPATYDIQGASVSPVASDNTTAQRTDPQQGGTQAPFPPQSEAVGDNTDDLPF